MHDFWCMRYYPYSDPLHVCSDWSFSVGEYRNSPCTKLAVQTSLCQLHACSRCFRWKSAHVGRPMLSCSFTYLIRGVHNGSYTMQSVVASSGYPVYLAGCTLLCVLFAQCTRLPKHWQTSQHCLSACACNDLTSYRCHVF